MEQAKPPLECCPFAPAAAEPSPPRPPERPGRKLLRAVSAFVFVYITLAAGHLMMVAINAIDLRVSAATYRRPGVEARWFGDEPLATALQYAHKGAPRRAGASAASSPTPRRSGAHLAMLPVSTFLIAATLGLILAGLGLLLWSRGVRSDAAQTVLGVFAGLSIWTGVEYSLMLASRVLGIAKAVRYHGGAAIGTYGEYVLLKHTWGILAMVGMYLLFLESNRCPFFVWCRRQVPLMRGAVCTGRIDNYAPRTAFEYIAIVWTFYLVLLWAYDPEVFGVEGLLTHALFFGSFALTGYLMLRLYRQSAIGPAVRYAIGVAIIAWIPIEIAAKWRLFREPWLILSPMTAVAFFGGAALGTWLVVWEIRRNRREAAEGQAIGAEPAERR